MGKKRRTLGEISDEHWKLELAIDELKDRIRLLEEKQGALEAEAIELSKSIDDTAARVYYGKNAVGKITKREHPKIVVPPKFFAFVRKTNRFELLESRIRSTTYFELLKEGVAVPGTEIFRHDVFTTKRRGKKE